MHPVLYYTSEGHKECAARVFKASAGAITLKSCVVSIFFPEPTVKECLLTECELSTAILY